MRDMSGMMVQAQRYGRARQRSLSLSSKEELMRLDQMPYHSMPTLAVLPFRQFRNCY